ncbi:MAG TPA: hypothetical protein VES69_01635 [Pyrinomonadaceae bacterium]|nr:hypothetical protein [Pyrinomonadaceae bacterium]
MASAFFGVRQQSEAATALWFLGCLSVVIMIQSGVALRLPPHPKVETVFITQI